MMKKVFTSKSFIISISITTAIAIAVIILTHSQGKGIIELLCNACFVAGVLVGGAGCLALVGNEGMFDIFGYGISFVARIHWPGLGSLNPEHRDESYVDYKERKQKTRKSPTGILIAGGIYLLLATIFLVIYLILE